MGKAESSHLSAEDLEVRISGIQSPEDLEAVGLLLAAFRDRVQKAARAKNRPENQFHPDEIALRALESAYTANERRFRTHKIPNPIFELVRETPRSGRLETV